MKGRGGMLQAEERLPMNSTNSLFVQTRYTVIVTGYCSHMEDGAGGIEGRLPEGGDT